MPILGNPNPRRERVKGQAVTHHYNYGDADCGVVWRSWRTRDNFSIFPSDTTCPDCIDIQHDAARRIDEKFGEYVGALLHEGCGIYSRA